MMDEFELDAAPGPEDGDAGEAIKPFDLPPVIPLSPEDGLPFPLLEVRKLLPGGPGVRGRPPIVYSQTRLDMELVPHLRETPPTLVVLSGNAGDGKTAFVSTVLASAGEPFTPGINEYVLDLSGHEYLVVLDGSEDAENRSNEELLSAALGPFSGSTAASPARGTIIAVNKGRLLEFLEARRAEYGYLWERLRRRFVDGVDEAADSYILVDLNDRSVIGPDERGSLFRGIVDKLVAWEGWDSCDQCFAKAACPALFNARSLSQPQVSAQLWRVFAAADLDDRLHMTARHLVTKVAAAVTSDLRCPDVRQSVKDGVAPLDDDFFYNRVFRRPDEESGAEQALMDRVLSSYDPSDLAAPRSDRQVAFHVVRGSVEALFDSTPGPDVDVIRAAAERLEQGSIDTAPEPGAPEFRTDMIRLTTRVARRLFFLDPEHDLAPGFPVRSLTHFRSLVDSDEQALDGYLPELVTSLNSTLGIEARNIGGLVVPKDYNRGLGGTGFAMVIPVERFRLRAAETAGAGYVDRPFLSSWPRALALVAHAKDGAAGRDIGHLVIPLLMFEILSRANVGFRPTSQTERSYMVRLQGFYRRIAEHGRASGVRYLLYDNGRVIGNARLDHDSVSFGAA